MTAELVPHPNADAATGRRPDRQARMERLHPHKLRHTFATLAQEAGVSVKKIHEALDHAQSSTTDIYLAAARRLEDDPSDLVAASIEEATRSPTTVISMSSFRHADHALFH